MPFNFSQTFEVKKEVRKIVPGDRSVPKLGSRKKKTTTTGGRGKERGIVTFRIWSFTRLQQKGPLTPA